MVLVYYLNLRNYRYFYKVLKYEPNYEEGFVNQYDHQVIGIYIVYKNKIYTQKEFRKLWRKKQEQKNTVKDDFIDKMVDILLNLKKR